ncbi:hypothetical protein AB205_0113450, partial [Aquarana catesbeiana]
VCCAFRCSTCIHGTVRCTNPGPALCSRHRRGRVDRRKLHVSAMYKESGYWDTRYERERALPEAGGHEWFGPYEDFAHLVRRQLRSGLRVLVLGCGTSSLSTDLYAEGVSPIISIDYSPICIKEMTERNAGIPEISWMVMDARQLKFPDKSFDLVIEKGTLDSMMVDEKDPWNITPATVNLVDEVLSEVRMSYFP